MLRMVGQSMLAVVFIYSVKLYVMQELLFWLAMVAVLCAFGTIVIAVVSWLRQMIRRGFRRIQTRPRGVFRTGTARIAHGRHA
jgi:hypothetical protein